MDRTMTTPGGDFRLYTGGDLSDLMCSRIGAAKEFVEATIPADSLLEQTDEEIVGAVVSKYGIGSLELGDSKILPLEEDGEDFVVYQITAFTGDPVNLKYVPSSQKGHPMGAVDVKKQEIKVMAGIRGHEMKAGPKSKEELEGMFAQNLERMNFLVDAANNDTAGFAERLTESVLPVIQLRREKLQNARASGT